MVNAAAHRSHRPAGAGPRRPAHPISAAERAATSEAERERQTSAAAVNAAADLADAGQQTEAERMADGLLGVNDQILAEEAAAIAREFEAPPPAADPAVEHQQQLEAATVEQAYEILSRAVVSQGAAVFVPNWNITPAETDDLGAAIVQALMIWFPDGMIPPKYMAILAIAGVGARIAIARRDPVSGELPPRYAPPPKRPTQPAPAAPNGVSHIPTH
jgi:hypothetical protein